MFRDIARIVLAGLVGAFIVAGYATWRIWDLGSRDEGRVADAIVVLGAAQYDGVPSPIFEARLAHAVDLHRAGLAPYFVVTGGKLPGDRTTEAATARQYALAHGIPDGAILVEDQGRTTLESLQSVAAMLEDRDLASAVFVSDRTHMLRVLKIARAEGIVAYGSPTKTSPSESSPVDRLRATIHEIGALAVYFVGGTGP